MTIALDALALVSCAWACFVASRVARAMRAVPRLDDLSPKAPDRWPKVSLVVPACNEEATLDASMRSRLGDDYPELEAILVEDRSTDGTPAIADTLAASDPRVRALHVRELPAGWLGKVHALHLGATHATGEWLLFSDADVHFAQGALRKAVALAEERALDHLVLVARIAPGPILVEATVGALLGGIAIGVDARKLEDPRSRDAVGGGIFSLVRRSALDRTPGFEWLKLEVIDDLVLGQMLKDAGARQGFYNAIGLLSLDWYASLGDMARHMEKNGFAIFGRYRLEILAATSIAALGLTWGPWVGLALGAPWLRAVCAASVLVLALTEASLARWLGRRPWVAILYPLGRTLLVAFGIRSAYLAYRRGGVAWRGTAYSLAELRAGSRLRLF